MNSVWRWILGIFVGLVIIGLVMSVRSNRAAYNAAHGDTQTSFQEVTWMWVQVNDHAKNVVTTIPDPSKYTILFHADGTLEGKADCNSFGGTYSQNDGGFFITLGPSTLAYCGDQSMDQQYLALLANIVAGGPTGTDQFALETAGGAQRLEFKQ